MIKKLRYFARFAVVCLLLNRTEMVKSLTEEVGVLIEDYTSTFNPSDSDEWNVVLLELSMFMEVC